MARITLPRQVGTITAEARKARGLMQAELARLAGVSRQLVNRLETGVAEGIALNKLLRILSVAGCALDVHPLDGEVPPTSDGARTASVAYAPEDVGAGYALDETLFEPAKGGE